MTSAELQAINFEDGATLLINKPLHWTSFDVVRKIRNLIKPLSVGKPIKKVGHAGTLDPLATGMLIICTGKFTKKINEYMGQEKEYTGTFTLGANTPTYDLESEPENFKPIEHLTETEIKKATLSFIGEIEQTPPIHSAIKKDGKRVYELARKGIDVKLEPRKITIKEFEVDASQLPLVNFRVVCSTGTYIRSLANDFGNALGCGAYLSSLCRTRIGDFYLQNAFTMQNFEFAVNELKEASYK